MAELKTKPTEQSVEEFLASIADPQQRADSQTIASLMQEVSGAAPRMWGPGIIGFGDYHYEYASGRSGDWFLTGFAPRKSNLTLYLNSGGGFDAQRVLLERLGKHKLGKGCLYIKRLADVDQAVLRELIVQAIGRRTQAGG
ncbi:MAG: DUF1801 domain-containing protein [Chloroflexi bacterium SZAS-1]|nr:DUF1801 domain-containing protein [Chloroflexi bacterium SZAS-1]